MEDNLYIVVIKGTERYISTNLKKAISYCDGAYCRDFYEGEEEKCVILVIDEHFRTIHKYIWKSNGKLDLDLIYEKKLKKEIWRKE